MTTMGPVTSSATLAARRARVAPKDEIRGDDWTAPADRGVRRLLALPASVARQGVALLDQQCWLWGQDVRRPEGNLLTLFGFTRDSVAQAKGSSAYRLQRHDAHTRDSAVELWSFGVFYGAAGSGGLYLARHTFAPRITWSAEPPIGAHVAGDLPAVAAPSTAEEWVRALRLLAGLLDWIAGYERWALATCGLPYREACVAAWGAWKSPGIVTERIPPARIAPTWHRLEHSCALRAARIERLLATTESPGDEIAASDKGH